MKALLKLSLLVAAAGIVNSGFSVAEAAKAADELTGFGASNSAWNHHHQENKRFAPGAVYGPPVPGLNIRFNDRYYAVFHGDGRVLSYSMRFSPRTGVRQAQALILASEFPTDAKIAWFKVKGSCAQMYVRSGRLASATHTGALVTFTSGAAGDHYTASAVADAILTALPNAKNFDC